MTTWHSQYNAGVDEAKPPLAGKRVTRLFVDWQEDVRKWHPGQAWIFRAGGFGVFDPGINALSIVTKIMPEPVFVTAPSCSSQRTPRRRLRRTSLSPAAAATARFSAVMDWRPIERDIWEITLETEDGETLLLFSGGARLEVNGRTVVEEKPDEYEAIYEISTACCGKARAMSTPPFQLVADAFMLGRRSEVDAFEA